MEVLVAYDVATDDAAGRRRLHQVAKACEGFGQRVQKSVFECVLSEMELARLEGRLGRLIDPSRDSLRIYRLREPRGSFMRVLGVDVAHDIRDPLVL
ncbi:MAG TPA: CRISPR-associated endonuclease Cas2 [Candidatus Limnocylindrales bacterium]|jgi:CRISPR-associated protein Cas2